MRNFLSCWRVDGKGARIGQILYLMLRLTNIHQYVDQKSSYGIRTSHSYYDFEVEDTELVVVASESLDSQLR